MLNNIMMYINILRIFNGHLIGLICFVSCNILIFLLRDWLNQRNSCMNSELQIIIIIQKEKKIHDCIKPVQMKIQHFTLLSFLRATYTHLIELQRFGGVINCQ